MTTTNCPRGKLPEFFSASRDFIEKEISISHPFMFVDHSIRHPSGSGNRPGWQRLLPLFEAIREGTRPKLHRGKLSHGSYIRLSQDI